MSAFSTKTENSGQNEVFICDAIRTPIGRYGGSLATIRADDLAALPLKALMARNPTLDFSQVDDVILGCANQAGEDNRNIARMATLLAGLPYQVPATTLNRLCGSGLNAVGIAMQAIKSGEAEMIIAGGVESMTRAPFVIGKAESNFSRTQEMFDTTMGWHSIALMVLKVCHKQQKTLPKSLTLVEQTKTSLLLLASKKRRVPNKLDFLPKK
jgi:acetyl-CoA acyltransferase